MRCSASSRNSSTNGSPPRSPCCPRACGPRSLASRDALIQYTLHLGEIHGRFRDRGEALAKLQELLLFFTHASVRITQVEAFGAEPPKRPSSASLDGAPPGPSSALKKPLADRD
jgi:hypothetical protein